MSLDPMHDHGDRPHWGVTRCECGVYRIKLGSLLLDLDHADFIQLVRLLSTAAEHFGAEGPPLQPQVASAPTH